MILEHIKEPSDLEYLSHSELIELSGEIRRRIIDVVSKNGGHLASNLGVVELVLAIHRIFRSPADTIIFDVGHQCYAHKLVTGRSDKFDSLRTFGGLSGFPKASESPHDAFDTGHASTALSAAQGIAIAKEHNGENGKVVAVVGDGALTGGMAFEALNYIGYKKNDVVVVLNDNKMSISPNVGALSKYLNQLRLEPFYTTPKDYLASVLKNITGFGGRLYKILSRIEGSLKYLLTPGIMFEELGFKYFGPVNGYDFESLERVLMRAKDRKGPVLVHVLTEKGRGYKLAQDFCEKFHGTGPFEISTGQAISNKANKTYTEVFGHSLCALAAENKSIVAITAAMKEGVGLCQFALEFPARFFDVGITEQHAVTMAAGMAKKGLRPFVAIYSTFLQRSFDQIIHDVALTNLPVVFCLDRAGLVGEDGPTHHGLFDISFMRCIPNMQVLAPRDEVELEQMLSYAAKQNGPVSIRYPRGVSVGCADTPKDRQPIAAGKAEIIQKGSDAAFIAVGTMLKPVMLAAEKLKEHGISTTVINARFIKPFDKDILFEIVKEQIPIITAEENVLDGGFGGLVAEHAAEMGFKSKLLRIGIPDEFIEHGSQQQLRHMLKIDAEGIYERVTAFLSRDLTKKAAL